MLKDKLSLMKCYIWHLSLLDGGLAKSTLVANLFLVPIVKAIHTCTVTEVIEYTLPNTVPLRKPACNGCTNHCLAWGNS